MSSRSLRCVLAGSLITAFLSLGGPAAGEASAFFAMPEAPSVWVRAWQWLTAQIAEAEEEGAAPAVPAVEAERGDAGWILDPNG
jgi:hypothetical protein